MSSVGMEIADPTYPEERRAMKRLCAWCGRELDQSERREGLQVTHGVCPDCRRRFFASTKAKEADSRSTQEDVGNDPGGPEDTCPTD